MVFHARLLQFLISQLLEYNKLEVFLEGWLHSIESDRMLILFESKNEYQPKISRLDASSMHCARIALDVVQKSQCGQGLCDFRLLDQQARRTLFVFCSNLDIQVPIHC